MVAMVGGEGAQWHHCRLQQCRAHLSSVEALVNLKETRVRVRGYGGATVWSGQVHGVMTVRAQWREVAFWRRCAGIGPKASV